MSAAFLIGAFGEKLGWQGHAGGAMRRSYDALFSALILGIVWAV